MSRILSKISIVVNTVVYAANGIVLFVFSLLVLGLLGDVGILAIPGLALLGLVLLIAPSLGGSIAGIFGHTAEEMPEIASANGVFQNIANIWNSAWNPSQTTGLPLVSFCIICAMILGVILIFRQGKLYNLCDSPMDWYYKNKSTIYLYAVLSIPYIAFLIVAGKELIGDEYSFANYIDRFASYFLAGGALILLGSLVLTIQCIVTCKKYRDMPIATKTKLNADQSKYMSNGERKRQLRILGKDK